MTDREIIIVAFIINENASGWYALDSQTMEPIAGPYKTHKNTCEYIEIRAFRLSKGWVA